MKFSIGWLKDYLDFTAEEEGRIEGLLLQAGVEVENIIRPAVEGFEIVRISRIEKHPNADRLNLCHLEGRSDPIVCGAKNVRAGLRCILAKLGTTIAGFKIEEKEIRGIKSCGMLCSANELDLDADNDGLYEVGEESIESIFQPNGSIYEVSITPNRGDLMSVYGIARELAAFGLGQLKSPNLYSLNLNFTKPTDNEYTIEVESEDVLSMYSIKIDNIKDKITPGWMKRRMKEVGLSSRGLIVDVTNYIAHSLGQPLHAFDADYVRNIVVQKVESCTFVDLKEESHDIKDMTMMVSDSKYVSMPGIIGGNYGKCSNSTANILLEAGNYSKEHIYKGRFFKKTQASKLFFHRVDPNITKLALIEAAAMIEKLGGGNPTKAYVTKEYPREETKIVFDCDEVPLMKLGFKKVEDSWVAPSWRNDIYDSSDLLEEIMRFNGYDSIPSIDLVPFKLDQSNHNNNFQQLSFSLVKDGFYEVTTHDFMSENIYKFYPQHPSMIIENPISDACYALRNSILGNLIEIYSTYMRYGWECPGIFEIGKSFNLEGETDELGMAFSEINTWMRCDKKFNYLEMKKIFESYVNMYYRSNVQVIPGHNALLDQVCSWTLDGEIVATFGILNQDCSKKYKIKGNMYLGSLNLDKAQLDTRREIETNQAVVTKDISLTLPAGAYSSNILQQLENPDFEVRVFDLYPDVLLESTDRALGLRLIFNQLLQPLTNAEINQIMDDMIKKLERLGCRMR